MRSGRIRMSAILSIVCDNWTHSYVNILFPRCIEFKCKQLMPVLATKPSIKPKKCRFMCLRIVGVPNSRWELGGPRELTLTVDTVPLTFLIHSGSIDYAQWLPDFFDRVSNEWL